MITGKTRVRWSLATMAFVLTMLVGCKIISPGVTYNVTWLEALISATPEEVTSAAKMVVEDMNLVLVSAESTGLDGRVVARTARKKLVTVTITRSARNISLIKIQVGRLGDESISLLVLEKIKERM